MKRWRSTIFVSALAGAMLLSANVVQASGPLVNSTPLVRSNALRDAAGGRLNFLTSDPATLLYNTVAAPVFVPAGHQLTFGEWKAATGTAEVKCIKKGTHVHVELTGLIPGGLYTSWVGTAAGGLGRLDSVTPHDNSFVASATGTGTVNRIAPAGPLSVSGAITSCLLDESGFFVIIEYHSDGNLYGPEPGPITVSFDHLLFVFMP